MALLADNTDRARGPGFGGTARRYAGLAGLIAVILSSPLAMHAAAADDLPVSSIEEAFDQGVSAYFSREYSHALPLLHRANKAGKFFAPFFLARIYGGDNPVYVNHGKAYQLYAGIVRKYGGRVTRDSLRFAPTVAKSMTAMAKYVFHGLPEIDLVADKAYAVALLRHASEKLGDFDAQFELARLMFVGDGIRKNTRMALYYFDRLAESGHAPAQAMLADVYWTGKFVPREPLKALVMITFAVRNAPETERIWIADTYQRIFCGSSDSVRETARGHVAGWDRRFGTKSQSGRAARPEPAPRDDLGPVAGPVRTCQNGEAIKELNREGASLQIDDGRRGVGPVSSTPRANAPKTSAMEVRRSPSLADPSASERTPSFAGANAASRPGHRSDRSPTETMRPAGLGFIDKVQ
ncbi:MAG: tetratricopeptide repeat protein [Pseudomonadota bacterium]